VVGLLLLPVWVDMTLSSTLWKTMTEGPPTGEKPTTQILVCLRMDSWGLPNVWDIGRDSISTMAK